MERARPHALLLAAGLGTRLSPLTDELPKPLLPVCNHSLLRWGVALCTKSGIRELAVNLHHLGPLIQAELGDGSALGVHLTYSPEETILGTGGGMRRMAALMPRQTCVVLNAKIVIDIDLEAVLSFHRAHHALATLVVRPDPHAESWGAIAVEEDGRIARILDEERPGALAAPPFQFTGIHVLEPELIAEIPAQGASCIIRETYTRLLAQSAPLYGYIHRGYFYDHSTLARYLEGNFNLLRGRAAPAARPGPLVGLDPAAQVHRDAAFVAPVLVGPRAQIAAGTRLGPDVIIGAGARVCAGVTLERAVVWPGVEVASSGAQLICTPRHCVRVPSLEDPTEHPRV